MKTDVNTWIAAAQRFPALTFDGGRKKDKNNSLKNVNLYSLNLRHILPIVESLQVSFALNCLDKRNICYVLTMCIGVHIMQAFSFNNMNQYGNPNILFLDKCMYAQFKMYIIGLDRDQCRSMAYCCYDPPSPNPSS